MFYKMSLVELQMNETEATIKVAEIALSNARNELYTDIVKIGIPSLIALAGIISTYILTKTGHKKDIKIEKLRNRNELNKENKDRVGELIKSISLSLSELHAKMLEYTSLLFSKMELENGGLIFPTDKQENLSELYQEYLNLIHTSFEIESKVYLLGSAEVDKAFVKYQGEITILHTSFTPSASATQITDLGTKLILLRDIRENIFNLLSNEYLSID